MSGETPGERPAEELSDLTVDDLLVRCDLMSLANTYGFEYLASMAQQSTERAALMEDEIAEAQNTLDVLRERRERLRRLGEIYAQVAELARSEESGR